MGRGFYPRYVDDEEGTIVMLRAAILSKLFLVVVSVVTAGALTISKPVHVPPSGVRYLNVDHARHRCFVAVPIPPVPATHPGGLDQVIPIPLAPPNALHAIVIPPACPKP